MNEFDQDFLEKYDSGYKFSSSELREICFELIEVESEYGENLRWVRPVTRIYQVGNRYFCLEWFEGLTESQEDEFWEQPYEVEKKEYEKTITVTEWIKKEGK